MDIQRDGITYRLTYQELYFAFVEKQHERIKEDVEHFIAGVFSNCKKAGKMFPLPTEEEVEEMVKQVKYQLSDVGTPPYMLDLAFSKLETKRMEGGWKGYDKNND